MTAEGSLLMATVNDDTAGMYTCTPYNSYGSMGSSTPTQVILQVCEPSRPRLSEQMFITSSAQAQPKADCISWPINAKLQVGHPQKCPKVPLPESLSTPLCMCFN